MIDLCSFCEVSHYFALCKTKFYNFAFQLFFSKLRTSLKNNRKNILQIRKNYVTLHSQKQRKLGSLAQLNRASDYGSEGYRFESCANHQ